jgi:hypothetical protein
MMRSGPSPSEQVVIRRMFQAGDTIDQVKRAFRDIEPGAIEAWERSLRPAVEPSPEVEQPPAEETPAAPPEAEQADPIEPPQYKTRAAKSAKHRR